MSEEVKQEGDFKIKKKPGRPKKLTKKNETVKLDLTKKEEVKDAVQEPVTEKVVLQPNEEKKEQEVGLQEVGSTHEEKTPAEEVKENKVEDTPVVSTIQEITDIGESTPPSIPEPTIDLPENVEKLVDFIKDTGGTVEDYVRLNADYSNVDNATLLKEYYKNIKPHLNEEEINFMMDDRFNYDEDMDEEREIRKKQLAIKEEIAEARNFLEGLKSKYYDEIKLRPGVTQEQQKAVDFFNRYNEEQQRTADRHKNFISKTNSYFSNEFKGTIAKHFYDQGVADGTKNVVANSKNINTDTRNTTPEDIYVNGWKVKAISGADSSKLKIQRRKTIN